MTDNIKQVDFNKSETDMIGALESLKRTLPHMVEYQATIAQYRFEVYNSYIEAGFDQEQALYFTTMVTQPD